MKIMTIYCLIYGFVISIILTALLIPFLHSKQTVQDEIKLPISYKVLKVSKIKKHKDFQVITYRVMINEHEYLMYVSSAYSNIIYRHYNDCLYCKSHFSTEFNNFSFSVLDGLDSAELNKMK